MWNLGIHVEFRYSGCVHTSCVIFLAVRVFVRRCTLYN